MFADNDFCYISHHAQLMTLQRIELPIAQLAVQRIELPIGSDTLLRMLVVGKQKHSELFFAYNQI